MNRRLKKIIGELNEKLSTIINSDIFEIEVDEDLPSISLHIADNYEENFINVVEGYYNLCKKTTIECNFRDAIFFYLYYGYGNVGSFKEVKNVQDVNFLLNENKLIVELLNSYLPQLDEIFKN